MRTWRAAVALVLLPLVTLTACGSENTISPSDERALADAIERQVPGVTVESTNPSGDGFVTSYEFGLTAETRTTDLSLARMQAREVSRVAWREAPVRAEAIEVTLKLTALSEPDCAAVTDDVYCEYVVIDIPTDAARRLWGENEQGGREEFSAGATFMPSAADGVPSDWDLEEFNRFEPDLHYSVFVPGDIGDAKLRHGVDRLARFLWREHPDRLRSVRIQAYFQRPSATSPSPKARQSPATSTSRRPVPPLRSTTVTYSAEELREKFGPRAADLER